MVTYKCAGHYEMINNNNNNSKVYFQVTSYRLKGIQTSLMHCPSAPDQPATIFHFKGMLIINFFYVIAGILCDTFHYLP